MPNEDGLFSQEEVNQIAGDARVKAREKAAADAQVAQGKATEEAEQAKLAAAGEWQKIIAAQEVKMETMGSLEAQVKAYEALTEGMLKDRVKELGDKAKTALATLPDGMNALEKLGWLSKNAELFQVTGDGVGTPNRPPPEPGQPTDKGPDTKYGSLQDLA